MPNNTDYGDISPRTAAYASKRLLTRAIPYLVIEKFGQSKPLPRNHSDSVKFRRYERFPFTPNAITEGVTPSARQLTTTDIKAMLNQYGDRITITDKIMDTHEDPVLSEAIDVLGEQAAQMLETVRFFVIRAGTNVFYSGGKTAREEVTDVIDLTLQRKIMRQLKRQDARKITRVLKSTPSYATQPVNACYIAICHPDCENDIRDLKGFTPVENYGTMTPFESEIGKVEDIRYLTSTILVGWPDSGNTVASLKVKVLSESATKADVYPIIYIAKDAYGVIPLKGEGAVRPMIVNPKPSDSDPMAQRGHAAWKAYQTAVILNDAWMIRAEVAVSA